MTWRTRCLGVAIVMFGTAGVAQATTGVQPPPGYQWASRDGANLSAYNYVMTVDGTYLGISTDPTGSLNWGITGNWGVTYIDAYFKDFLNGSAPSIHPLQFDIKMTGDDGVTNEFAGYSYWSVSTQSDGSTYFNWVQEVNGEFHEIDAETDAQGNVVYFTPVKSNARNQCKTISDWGVYQCPANRAGPIDIPTKIRSLIRTMSWYGDAWNTVSGGVSDAANWLSSELKDPDVQHFLIDVGFGLVLGGCCWASIGTGCVLCATGAALGAVAATQAINDSDPANMRSSPLRSRNVIGCESADCFNRTDECSLDDTCDPSIYVCCGWP